MKASDVRVLPALDPGESYIEPNFLLVETRLGHDGDTVTAIDHVTVQTVDGKERWTVTALGHSVPMTHPAAREWSLSYAASRNIPLVYERDNTTTDRYAAARNPGEIPLSNAPK